MPTIKMMNPFRCRMWEFHDRLDAHINERTCRAEIASFSTQGQLVPVLGRALLRTEGYDVELITGARRLFVARHLNLPLAVEIRVISDRDALIAMDTENRLRKDLSPYERALSYSQWLRSGLFKSQEELAQTLKISAAQVSRVLRLSQLPAVIVDAFEDPTGIREMWALRLLSLLEQPETRRALMDTARALAARPVREPPREVYRRLLVAVTSGTKLKRRHHEVVVQSDAGLPLFRIRHQRDRVAVLLPMEQLAEHTLTEISQAIVRILQAETRQAVDLSTVAKVTRVESSRSRVTHLRLGS